MAQSYSLGVGSPNPSSSVPGFLDSSSPTGGRTAPGFSLAARSPFLVAEPDDFWVPGRGTLGEVPGALSSFDMLVSLGPSWGWEGGTGLCGSPWGWLNQGSLFRVYPPGPTRQWQRGLRVPLQDNGAWGGRARPGPARGPGNR